MRIVVNAGHTKSGTGTGANGYLNESKETRKIAYELMKLLADSKHEIIPAVSDRSENNLKEAVQIANEKNAELFVSIHLNAGGGQGCEAYTWRGEQVPQAVKACSYLKKLGFKNRGVKDGSNLYVIKNTKCTAVLIEVCFVDSKTDAELYKKVGVANVAKAIYSALNF
jgi:N-acetylmuramoyl-L-alanine amidase